MPRSVFVGSLFVICLCLCGSHAISADDGEVQGARDLLVLSDLQHDSGSISTLNGILTMDLPDSPHAHKILSDVHRRLGDLYGHSRVKRLHHYALALQYATGHARKEIRGRIEDLGGDTFAMAFNDQVNNHPLLDPGPNDSCAGAEPLVIPFSATVEDISAPGDHNWYQFDVATGVANGGLLVSIGTTSNPGASGFDDSDLKLYSDCAAGVPGGFLGFDDDDGPSFMSLLESGDELGCLGDGTYYLEVGGFADISVVDDFTLSIEVLGDCVVPCVPSGAIEVGCDDGVDGDCDGLIDGDDPDCAPLVVTLESFTAERTPAGVRLRWSTTSEENNVGFRILRGVRFNSKSGSVVDLQQISFGLIPAQGTALFGAQYEHMDVLGRKSGLVHYYLEDVDSQGVVTRHGPAVIDFGAVGKPGTKNK